MKLIIEDDEGRKTVIPLVREEISIGRKEGNTIRLTERNVSRRHARLLKQNGTVLIEDLGSAYGVRVNGERINDAMPIFDGDRIQIGDYGLTVEGAPRPASAEPPRLSREMAYDTEEVTPLASPIDAGKVIPPERMPHFMGLASSVWGLELPLSRTIMSFGRAQDANDLVIDHPSVSRNHGRLKFEGGTWRIYDLGSSQGIKVNGRAVTASVIQPGDTVEIGLAQFRFCAPGDDFQPPRNGFVSAAGETQVVMRPQSKKGLYIGLVIGVLVVAGGAVVAWKFLGSSALTSANGTPDNFCQKAQLALNARSWSEAASDLESAKQLGTDCSFPIEPALRTAKLNLDAKNALAEAEELLGDSKYRLAIQTLTKVSSESVYSDAARAKLSEARLAGVKQLSLDVQTALDRGRVDEATTALNDLKAVDAEAPTLPFLQKQLADVQKGEKSREEHHPKEKTTEASPSPSPTPSGKPAVGEEAKPPKAEEATPVKAEEKKAPEPSPAVSDKDQVAQVAIQEGISLMSKGDFTGGIERLKFAIAQKPRTDLIALAHKNIGVGYAKARQPESAVTHLKIYLRLKPEAPDRAMIEQLVQQVEGK